ncbi:hypothetical protein DLM86_09640 [Paenibacillus flagellatus]|uniref:Uncharacterized protein n=1 Tax=Paenibacillus flagellatus TaxID=2211139 RepID=A0A2V5KT29_9BACL|nr:hypothetical protein DLM86_09640 [Paenibacillus flagellatus]
MGTAADGVRRAGALPLVVPFNLGEDDVRRRCEGSDGLLVTGGPDVDPSH